MARLFEIVISLLLGMFTSFLFAGDMSQTIPGAIFWILVFIFLSLPEKKKKSSN